MIFESLRFWLNVYEGEGDGAGGTGDGDKGGAGGTGDGAGGGTGDGAGGTGDGDKGGKSKQFSQDDLNRFLAGEKRKWKQSQERVIEELEALKSKANLTSEERLQYDERIEQMKNELLTKEELSKKELQKTEKKFKKDLEDMSKDRDGWKGRYVEATIRRAITDAAVVSEAYRPEQIVAILRPHTRLVEELDDEGKPTGELVPKVTLQDKDKDGKPVTLDLSPGEAAKRMKEMEDYFNLFKGEGTGGLGSTNRGAGAAKTTDLKTLAQDPAKYREARKAGKVKFD